MTEALHPSRRWVLPTLSVLMFAVGIAGAVSRKALVPLLIAVCLVIAAQAGVKLLRAFRPSPLMIGAAVFFAWAAVSAVWGLDVHLFNLLRVAITAALCVIGVWGVASLPEDAAARLDSWIIGGGLLLVAFLVEERLSGAWVTALLHPEPEYQVAYYHYPRKFDYAGGGAVVVASTCLSIAALMWKRWRSVLATIAYIAIAFVISLFMPMAAATVAMGAGAAAFTAAYYFPRATLTAMFAALALFLLAAPAIATLPGLPRLASMVSTPSSELGVQDDASRQARLGIWRYVVAHIAEAPVKGHGFGASRDFSARGDGLSSMEMAALPIHPHNGFLQIWLELGGVGAAIGCGLLFLAWRATRTLWERPLAAAVAAGTLASAAVPMLISFSLWNTWWLAALGFAAMFAARAIKSAPGAVAS